MKHITKIILTITIFITTLACSDDHFDVNVPSNAVDVEQLSMSDLLGPVIHSTISGQHSVSQSFSNYSQYMVGQGGTAVGLSSADGLWDEVYLHILPNIATIKDKAAATNSIHFDAVASIITAANLGIATDAWDNIPYSSASQGTNNTSPSFDTQQDIYVEIFNLLDDAISKLNQTDNSGILPGNEDLIYRGNLDKWKRAAYTLKARYQLRLMNKGLINASEVLTTIANGFTSNADDFQMNYEERNLNPWYTVEVVAKSTGNFHNDLCEQLVSSMNGDLFPFENAEISIDPRLSVFGDNDGASEWKGYISGGAGLSPDGTEGNVGFAANSYYTSPTSPITLITYAEAKFIEAEAAFWENGGSPTSVGSSMAAYNAYMLGIQASLDKFGVDGTDYIADGSIAVGADNLKLEHIMKEKYIHNFLNPESFSDFRRYDFSGDVFRGLELRDDSEEEDPDFIGQWFRRADYPSTERTRNPAVVAANEKIVTAPVWWDE